LILKDWELIRALSSNYNQWKDVTDIYISDGDIKNNELVNRVVKADELWSVVKSNHANRMTVWGNLSGEVSLFILPTYQLRSDSPDVDQGLSDIAPKQDIFGNSRPLGNGVDLGANEFTPKN